MYRRTIASTLLAASAFCAQAAVECLMPNGIVITQQLSDRCPAGATGGRETSPNTPAPGPLKLERKGRTGNRAEVTQRQFGDQWPLVLGSGTLVCERPLKAPDQMAVLFIHTSGVYAINGTARTFQQTYGWKPLAQIWRSNSEIPGTKIPITPLLNAGLSLCRD